MANFNYILTPCDGDVMKNNYVLSSETELTSGDTYSIFISETLIGCFTIGEITTNSATNSITTDRIFADCIACLTGNTLYLRFQNCDDGTIYAFETSDYFTEQTEIPIIDLIYYMNTSVLSGICLQFLSIESSRNGDIILTTPEILNTYTTCLDCLPPLSSGTETDICQVCIDSSGNTTAIFIDAPHPTWTDGRGRSVIQLNMIVLGGQNGLNN
jgi:hypothetical protein